MPVCQSDHLSIILLVYPQYLSLCLPRLLFCCLSELGFKRQKLITALDQRG